MLIVIGSFALQLPLCKLDQVNVSHSSHHKLHDLGVVSSSHLHVHFHSVELVVSVFVIVIFQLPSHWYGDPSTYLQLACDSS